jgi:ditrans,polycis-polyprenyl diphosphate synthase
LQERGIIERHGVRVQVLGDLSRLPDSVAAAAQRCMAATSHQTRCVLNICLAYT